MSLPVHFQNPSTGCPMYLTRSRKDGKLMVLIEDQADYAAEDESDAQEMSLRIRERDLCEASAVRMLRREFEVDL